MRHEPTAGEVQPTTDSETWSHDELQSHMNGWSTHGTLPALNDTIARHGQVTAHPGRISHKEVPVRAA